MTAPIELDGLTRSYGRRRGIVDVEVREGEVFGFRRRAVSAVRSWHDRGATRGATHSTIDDTIDATGSGRCT